MNPNLSHSNVSSDASLNRSRESPSPIDPLQEPFLCFDENTELSFEDKSRIYNSLVALIRAEHPFDKALQDRAARLLKSLKLNREDEPEAASKLDNDLVFSSTESPSKFLDGIHTLLSSSHSTIVAAALSSLFESSFNSYPALPLHYIESDLVPNLLRTVQPHTISISEDEAMIDSLVGIISHFVYLTLPWSLSDTGVTAAVDAFNHREMIFQKVVLPSSQFVTFLISKRHVLNRDLCTSFVYLLSILFQMGPFHRPTLKFVLSSPIVMGLTSCLSLANRDFDVWSILAHIAQPLSFWTRGSAEVTQSGKRMMQELFSEGFEDTLEQMLRNNMDGDDGFRLVDECHLLSNKLGLNVEFTELWDLEGHLEAVSLE
ncbi:hypothetical protein BLNAU_23158 [Blattamonas nauphoetae]|uniref:Uncharacterized protein n=1 Tax=Blattamonas nauphoetae TaxID=2049346 RepID=A0ABQ9WT77_9EUKA|nr:hypothetical protein BLNAU_23158 [Blattamonas nauphoetae]